MRRKKIVRIVCVIVLSGYIMGIAYGQTVCGNRGALQKRTAAALNPNIPPGGNFNLSIWSLQLPTGSGSSIAIIPPAQLAGADGYTDTNYFFTDKTDGAMTFVDPATGALTSGSLHCRTELREMSTWAATGTNIMSVTGELVRVGGGPGGHVTVGQVFDRTAGTPMCELEYYNTGNFKLLLEKNSAGGNAAFSTLAAQSIGSPYTYSLSLSGSTLVVTVNGTACTFTPDKTFKVDQFYFKCGDYDQTATSGPPSMTPYTIVKVYSLKVRHENDCGK
jgi:hypothetical protein